MPVTSICAKIRTQLIWDYIIIMLTLGFLALAYGLICRNLRDDECSFPCNFVEPLGLYDEVLQCNPEAFEYVTPGKQSTFSHSIFLGI